MAGGPIRAICRPDVFSQSVEYRDNCEIGVITLQMPSLPEDNLIEFISQTPFQELFEESGRDFHQVGRELDSPARVIIYNEPA